MLYYGTLFLAMGSMLFAWWCPVEVKQYASALNLADAERHHRTAHNQTNNIARELESLYEGMSKWENSIFTLPRLKPDQPNLGVGTSPVLGSSDQWGLGLIHIWTVNDIKRPTLRIIIFLLFSAGLALLAVPVGFTLVQVTLLPAKHLLTYVASI